MKKTKQQSRSLITYCERCDTPIHITPGHFGKAIICHSSSEMYCSMECFAEKKGDFAVIKTGRAFLEWLEVRVDKKEKHDDD